MSYRDVRNLIEMLRALSYPNLVSMESFRTPNFPLVADLLVWLCKRFDPETDIPLDTSTEDDRVKLIRTTAQFMALKANIKLNTKKLYQADGYSVKELLKITTLLYEALHINLDDNEQDQEEENFSLRDFDISDKASELKLSRQLASEITSTGASLFDLLAKEVDLRQARQKSTSRQFELSEVEEGIKKAVEQVKNEISETKQLIDNVTLNESSLDSKIERRKIEIDRYEKRLQTLKKVRPAFLEEFTALEQELEQLFVQYSVRLRCLNQLEKAFAESERIQYEKQLEITSPRVQTIPFEAGTLHDEEDEINDERPVTKQERPRASTGSRSRLGKAKNFSSMQANKNSESSLDLSSDSESEMFLDKDEPELIHSDDESFALELSAMDKRAPSGRKTSNKQLQDSDDDF